MPSVYQINKGINQAIVFKGFKAQYIWYLGGALVTVLVLFAALYISGVNAYLCVFIALAAGGLSIGYIYSLSNRYGEHGLIKKLAAQKMPRLLRSRSRNLFIKNKNVHGKALGKYASHFGSRA